MYAAIIIFVHFTDNLCMILFINITARTCLTRALIRGLSIFFIKLLNIRRDNPIHEMVKSTETAFEACKKKMAE